MAVPACLQCARAGILSAIVPAVRGTMTTIYAPQRVITKDIQLLQRRTLLLPSSEPYVLALRRIFVELSLQAYH